MLKLLAIFTVIVVCANAQKGCHLGPSYWCLNSNTAKDCGAISYCKFANTFTENAKKFANPEEKIAFHNHDETNADFHLDASPVNISLYYEALCPACRQLIMNQIWPTYNKLATTGILNLKFVPYGNAQQRQYGNQWTFYCQHGPAECLGNMLESCAMYHYPKPEQYMPFLHCMEYYQPTLRNAQYCSSLAKINYNAIYSCAYSEEGNKVEHLMGVETESLNPRHQYVPWVTMNGYHSDYIQNELSTNMLNYVCQTYRGTKPKECYASEKLDVCQKNN